MKKYAIRVLALLLMLVLCLTSCDMSLFKCAECRDANFDGACDVCRAKLGEAHTTHVFDNDCDKECNVCGAKRSPKHTYDNGCDATCNVCAEERDAKHAFDSPCDALCGECLMTRNTSHAYDNACDAICNKCSEIRLVRHVYDNDCDAECNACHKARSVTHRYDDGCDTECNICHATRAPMHEDKNADGRCDGCEAALCLSHVYDNACDTDCNVCGNGREITHVYDNACDTDCNVCTATREITHKYDNSCDASCNVCGAQRSVAHKFDNACDNTCNACSYTRAVGEHKDADNNGKCDYCAITLASGSTCKTKSDHKDANADGTCDSCNISVVVVLDFYVLNDLHGKLCDTSSQVGVDELTSYLKGAQTRDEHSIILSSGDMWQGSAESNLTGGIMMTEWMNTAGFVSMTIGNHEYDWGEDKVIANAAAADFPFLAINIFDRSTNQRVSYCDASVMVTRGDLTIGIIGAVGDCYSSISADRVEDIYFKTGSELTALVKAESDRLRSLGADIIVYSLHDGYGSSTSSSSLSVANLSSYYDISLSNGYVDVVFEGHTHQSYAAKDSYGVYHLQGAGENKGISHVEMAVNFVTDKASVTEAAFVSSSVYSSYEDSAEVLALFNSYESVLTDAYSVLGENAAYRNSNYICDLVAMLYYELGVEEWGDEYNIFLGGGFIKARSPYNLQAGDVTYADILTIMPFDNKLQLCSIKGRYLKSKFINTSNSDYHIYYGEYGASLIDSIDDNATYYIIVDSYTALYAPNNLTVVADYPDDNLYARDLLADYIRSGGLE